MGNIWQDLKIPILCLAPMDGVTDTVLRSLLVKLGKPDLMFTEFVHVKSIFSHDQTSFVKRLQYQKKEKPLIAQIWGTTPELFEAAAELLVKLNFDGIDINMGCPDRSVTKKGAGSGLINTPKLAQQIIQATQRGANKKIPVSAKTRLGFNSINTKDWIGFLLSLKLDALTIHVRTTKEQSLVEPHWDEMKLVIKLKDKLKATTKIIGNGDIFSLKQAHQVINQYHLDGIMIGRGIFRDPFIFNPTQTITTKTPQEKLNLLLDHLKLFESLNTNPKAFHTLKRFFKVYVRDFENALTLRTKLMETSNLVQARAIIKDFKQ
jgi:tRNA-dihydrouridine synthase